MTPECRAKLVKEHAAELGFERAGITHLKPPPHGDHLRGWLTDGLIGTSACPPQQSSRAGDQGAAPKPMTAAARLMALFKLHQA